MQQRKVHPSAIYIQAGSFGVSDNAQRMLAKRAGRGAGGNYLQAIVNGKTFYRVRVGPLSDVDQAGRHAAPRGERSFADGAKIVVD